MIAVWSSNLAVERPRLGRAAHRGRSPHGRAAIVEECSA